MRTWLLPLLLTLVNPAWAGDWKQIDDTEGIVTSRKEVEGSSMLAFRGEGDSAVPIGKIVAVLLDPTLGPEWVDLQVKSVELARPSATESRLYQVYDLSWPISDRDYVLRRKVSFDPAAKVVTVTYNSVEDAAMPEQDCCVRATAHRTYWRLTATPTGTHLEVEVHTDPKGMLPAWMVNMVQKGWPRNSITGLTTRANQGDVAPDPRTNAW